MNSRRNKLNRYLLGAGLSALILSAITPQAMGRSPQSSSVLSEAEKSEILAQHNEYRAVVNSPDLQWSEALEQDAKQWVQYLSSLGGKKLVHASDSARNGQGENLWMGTSGYFSPSDMVQTWGKEKQYFQAGTFPNVSTTGSWSSVGHYTQVVWKNTTKVGCAKTRAGGNDLLVCRYDPSGNVMGQPVF